MRLRHFVGSRVKAVIVWLVKQSTGFLRTVCAAGFQFLDMLRVGDYPGSITYIHVDFEVRLMSTNKPAASSAKSSSFNCCVLPEWISARLTSYTTAAGLGAFGLVQHSDAAIVYTDVPDTTISQGQGPIYINLDNVGQNEFAIAAFSNSVRVNPYNVGGQQSLVLTSNSYYVNSFVPGALIGPDAAAASGGRFAGRQSGPDFYNFVGTDKYVGLKWDIGGGDFRFGWARVDVTPAGGGTATLFSYAYETAANTAIAAGVIPEPSALALLAAGGGAVALRRRRNS